VEEEGFVQVPVHRYQGRETSEQDKSGVDACAYFPLAGKDCQGVSGNPYPQTEINHGSIRPATRT